MRIEVKVPKWGSTMEDAEMGDWLVQVGASVEEGQPLVELETDKITNELESPGAGRLVEVLVERGQTVEVGQVIAYLEAD